MIELNTLGIISKAKMGVTGIENVKKYLKKLKIKKGFFIIAKDASESTRKKALFLKEKYNLPLIELGTKKELAKFFKKEEVSFIYVKTRGFLKIL
ncbi:MAG: ribosomal L7Ae/L30e/S12e/Gadd45 family protein [candidate division WOR-3 bacterium]